MTATDTPQRVITPSARRVLLRALFWVGAVLFILLIGVATLASIGGTGGGAALGLSNAAPDGAKAVAEVLKQQGVDVIEASSLDQVERNIDDPSTTTLVIHDALAILDRDQLIGVGTLADRVILVDPGFIQLRALAPEVAQAGYVGPDAIAADCAVDAVDRAESVSGGGSGFRLVDDTLDTAIQCLGSGSGVFSLIELDGGRMTVLGATNALTNQLVINDGNAAFALALLGQTDRLVWYIPGIDDVADTSPETLGSLTPLWVTPVILLLIATFVAGAVWRGRRLGPLVIENLPVTVRASETMLGRARLYEKSSSRLRALDALRIGSIQRLAKLCGLPSLATVDDVIASCAAVTARQSGELRALLVDTDPATDRDLMMLSDSLLTLERDIARAVRP